MLTLSRDKGAPVPGRRVVPREQGRGGEGPRGLGGGRGSGRLRHHGPYEDDSYEMLLTAYLGIDLHYTLTQPDI